MGRKKRGFSQNPDAVRIRKARRIQQQTDAQKKRKSVAAKNGHRGRMLSRLLETHRVATQTHGEVVRAVIQHVNGSAPSISASSASAHDNGSIPSSVGIPSGATSSSLSVTSSIPSGVTGSSLSVTSSPAAEKHAAPSSKRKRSDNVETETETSNESIAASLDQRIPKKTSSSTPMKKSLCSSLPPPTLSAVYKANPVALLRSPLAQYDFSQLVFGQHAQHRLRVRGGLNQDTALQLMANGTIVASSSREHDGQLVVQYRDERGVEHQWPLEFRTNGVLVRTYIVQSPLRTDHDYRLRRDFMLRGLRWLSIILDVPLPLTGWYLARAIEEFDVQLLYCPGLPTVMDVVWYILPTKEELELLREIPYASEMGDPENWIAAIGNFRNIAIAHERLAFMHRMAWLNYDVEMGPGGRDLFE